MGGAGGDALNTGNYNHAHAHANPTWTPLSLSKLTVKANLLRNVGPTNPYLRSNTVL